MKKFLNKIKSNKGNSLAEFAVTAAMMATLATTAAPRFSGVGEVGKQNQTKANLEKLGKMANQYYMDTSSPPTPNNPSGEGQGRIPGQERYDTKIGGYNNLSDVRAILNEQFNKWDDGEGGNWRSVFGLESANASYSGEYQFTDESTDYGQGSGAYEWRRGLSAAEGPIKSPYQQGHYIYIVIPGGQQEIENPSTGELQVVECNECGPILVLADAYNPSKFHTIKSFN